jgi:hypothetical protein
MISNIEHLVDKSKKIYLKMKLKKKKKKKEEEEERGGRGIRIDEAIKI